MQTYHKHGMGESITLVFEITSNGAGVIEQTPVAAVRKKSNGQWLNDAKTGWQAGYNDIAMAELDATNLPGTYTLDITHIDITSEEYQVYFKNTGAYAGMDFETHVFTGAVYIPASSSYATGTVRGLLDLAMNKDINRTFDQATDSLEALKDADETVDLAPVINAIAALQADFGDPSADTTNIYAQILLLKGYVDTLETALATHEANRVTMQATLVAEHDATQTLVNEKVTGNTTITIVGGAGSVQASYAEDAGSFTLKRGDGVSIPFRFKGDSTGKKVYYSLKKEFDDSTFKIAPKLLTGWQIVTVAGEVYTDGVLPHTYAETKDLSGSHFAEIKTQVGTDDPVTAWSATLKVKPVVATKADLP